ncbi:RluA family pseudouridine synthase [Candidatus Woesebacteria bacterium]|nr:RluA family pseudouridine synthase [Candidatus Woesebacteria bacterium]
MNIKIIYEDQDLLVINKPPGLVVNRAETVKVETLQDWLEKNIEAIGQRKFPTDWRDQIPEDFTNEYGTPEEIFETRTGLAHRLDKDTSGIMLIAKHPGSLLSLLKEFRTRKVQKRYTCLVHGKFAMAKGEVNLPLGRRPSNRKLFAVVPDGRPAQTLYEVKNFYPKFDQEKLISYSVNPKALKQKRFSLYEGFSLVSCWPKTGRTHQIRVHMSYLKHPIVGDQLYVGKKRVKLDSLWCYRQFLHASELEFNHPRTGERVSYTADLTDDLIQALAFVS